MNKRLTIFYCTLLIIIGTPVFISCNNHEKTIEDDAGKKATSRYAHLESYFTKISGDTLFVTSYTGEEGAGLRYKGVPVDSITATLLPTEIRAQLTWNKDIGACYQFKLDSQHVALIARTSGEYVSSAIDLLVFNLKKDSVTEIVPLADNFGDAGETSEFRSYLYKEKQKLMIITYARSDYDHSVMGDSTDTITEHWNNYSVRQILSGKADTVSKDSASIVFKYRDIIKRLE